MPQTVTLSTVTTITTNGADIDILTEYSVGLPVLMSVLIADVGGTINYTPYNQGELVVTSQNLAQTWATINNNGELIITSTEGDEANYSIDSNGDLIYTP